MDNHQIELLIRSYFKLTYSTNSIIMTYFCYSYELTKDGVEFVWSMLKVSGKWRLLARSRSRKTEWNERESCLCLHLREPDESHRLIIRRRDHTRILDVQRKKVQWSRLLIISLWMKAGLLSSCKIVKTAFFPFLKIGLFFVIFRVFEMNDIIGNN
jgi:hypothetical protein